MNAKIGSKVLAIPMQEGMKVMIQLEHRNLDQKHKYGSPGQRLLKAIVALYATSLVLAIDRIRITKHK